MKVDNENVGNVKVDNEKVGNVKVDNENTLNNNLKQVQSQNLINQPVIVYMVSYNTYLTKLSRVRFHGINKLQNHIKVIYYGNGWLDYNNKLSVSKNIENLIVFCRTKGFEIDIKGVTDINH